MTRVLIAGGGTGGHLMPALAIADALRAVRPDVEPVLVGAQRGIDATLLPQRPYRFHLLPAEPIHRRAWWRNARWPFLLGRLLRAGSAVLREEAPRLALGTGGYAAGPILAQALRRGIPVALQEQNAYPGVTTRWLAKRARQVHLGFPEAERHLRVGRQTQVFRYGNPVVPPPVPRADPVAARSRFGFQAGSQVVLIVGGSQGARAINHAVREALQRGLLSGIGILWSTGSGEWEELRHLHEPPLRHVRPFLDPIGEAYEVADLVVARSGAMTTAELCAWGHAAVLVPLPSAAAGHQARNAAALADVGAAVHLPQSEMTPEGLAQQIRTILGDPDRLARMRLAASLRGRPHAATDIARELLAILR